MEAVSPFDHLKFWKEAPLQSTDASGLVDYLLGSRAAVLEAPVLAVVEAKKEDFEAGRVQCLAELAACASLNENKGVIIPEIFGAVSNGAGWIFLNWEVKSKTCRQSGLFGEESLPEIIAILRQMFHRTEQMLSPLPQHP